MVELAPAASELVQLVVSRKSPLLVPVSAIAVIVSEAFPEFLRVTVSAGLVTPVATVPKFKLVGARVTAGPLLAVTVTVTTLEVELGYVPLPRKVAVTELAPDCSAV